MIYVVINADNAVEIREDQYGLPENAVEITEQQRDGLMAKELKFENGKVVSL